MMSMPTLTDHAREHRVTRVEFEAFRDEREKRPDGARYELLDGEIVVTPWPTGVHQLVVSRLIVLLSAALPSGWEVVSAPLDVILSGGGDTALQPDVLLTTRGHLTEGSLSVPPKLVLEVLSASTWRRDLGPKREAYASAGVQHYWVIAPDTPSITVYRLAEDEGYREEAHLTGDQLWDVTSPVEVTLCPADLVR